MGSWIFKQLTLLMCDAISGLMDFFGNLMSDMFSVIAILSNTNEVKAVLVFTSVLGLVLLAVKGSSQIVGVYGLEMSGDPDLPPGEMLVRIAVAVAVICSNVWIFDMLLYFSNVLARDLTSSADSQAVWKSVSEVSAATALNVTAAGGILIIMLLIIAVSVIIYVFMAGIRGAELTLMKILLPIFAMDILTTNREKFNAFLMDYIITFVSYSIQLLCFRLFSVFFTSIAATDFVEMPAMMIVCAGWVVLMFKVPKWLQKYAYSTGIGRAAGAGIRMIPYMMRKV